MKTPLREIGRVDHQPQDKIIDAMEGVNFDYNYSGQRVGANGQIELSVTTVITDWDKNIYYRTSRYLGHYQDWKNCIRTQLWNHLIDLGVGIMLVRVKLEDFEVDKSNYSPQEK
jgi:hypothetical protein